MLLRLVNKNPIFKIFRLSSTMANKTVNFDEIEKLANDSNVLIVDVREPDEVKSTGLIGNSINIPLANIKNAIHDSAKEAFVKTYNRPKPNLDFPLIFYCLKGGRALKALETAETLGFKNVRYYKGSWTEWASKHS